MQPTQNRNITNEIVSAVRPWPRKSGCAVADVGDLEHVEEPHRRPGERGVLEQADELPDDRRDHVAQRLGQHDQGVVLHRRQPERLGRLGLAAGQRLQPAADDLGDVGRGEQGEHDDRPHDEAGRLHPTREEEAEGDAAEQQQHVQRHAAEELDVGDRDARARAAASSRRADAEPGEAEHERRGRSAPSVITSAAVEAAADEQRQDGTARPAARRATIPPARLSVRRPARRPRASSTPSGNDRPMPAAARKRLSIIPPHSFQRPPAAQRTTTSEDRHRRCRRRRPAAATAAPQKPADDATDDRGGDDPEDVSTPGPGRRR